MFPFKYLIHFRAFQNSVYTSVAEERASDPIPEASATSCNISRPPVSRAEFSPYMPASMSKMGNMKRSPRTPIMTLRVVRSVTDKELVLCIEEQKGLGLS